MFVLSQYCFLYMKLLHYIQSNAQSTMEKNGKRRKTTKKDKKMKKVEKDGQV